MAEPKGIEYEITDEGADLYVNHEGLQLLRDNTTRPYSQFFAGLVTEFDEEQARKYDAPDQEPLPGL
jgi:hypothetical protein